MTTDKEFAEAIHKEVVEVEDMKLLKGLLLRARCYESYYRKKLEYTKEKIKLLEEALKKRK